MAFVLDLGGVVQVTRCQKSVDLGKDGREGGHKGRQLLLHIAVGAHAEVGDEGFTAGQKLEGELSHKGMAKGWASVSLLERGKMCR